MNTPLPSSPQSSSSAPISRRSVWVSRTLDVLLLGLCVALGGLSYYTFTLYCESFGCLGVGLLWMLWVGKMALKCRAPEQALTSRHDRCRRAPICTTLLALALLGRPVHTRLCRAAAQRPGRSGRGGVAPGRRRAAWPAPAAVGGRHATAGRDRRCIAATACRPARAVFTVTERGPEPGAHPLSGHAHAVSRHGDCAVDRDR